MEAAWSVADVRAAEGAVIARVGDDVLMQRAAYGLAVQCVSDLRARVRGARIAVLAGAGNNGGDALFAAAHLARRGARVDVLLLAPDRVHGAGLRACLRAGAVRVADARDKAAVAVVGCADLVLDGIVGIGGSGPLRPPADRLADAAADGDGVTVAVDLPSGVDPDTGAVTGPAVRADVTVTFGCLKPGLLVGAGRSHCGDVRVVEIGLGAALAAGPGPALAAYTPEDVTSLLPTPTWRDSKYTRGVVGIVAGSAQFRGAASLAVGAALATGVGMVRVVSVPEVVAAVVGHWPSAVATEVFGGGVGALDRAGRVQAWVLGPGMGTDADAETLVTEALATDVPVVLDADALTILARDPGPLRTAIAQRTAPTLLTPHDGEFARVFGTALDATSDRIAAVRAAARDFGATVLLKGDATLVAEPAGGPVLVNRTGTGWLASAGSGDVLAGVIGALAASGVQLAAAAATGAYVHGMAARSVGGGSSGDLVPAVAVALHQLRGADSGGRRA